MLLELESAPSSACLRLIPLEIMQRYFLFPFSLNEEDHVLSVAFSDSDDFDLMADLQAITGCWIQPFQSTSERILEWIDAYCHTMTSTNAKGFINTTSQQSPVVRLVDEIISEAMHGGISDIHFEIGRAHV